MMMIEGMQGRVEWSSGLELLDWIDITGVLGTLIRTVTRRDLPQKRPQTWQGCAAVAFVATTTILPEWHRVVRRDTGLLAAFGAMYIFRETGAVGRSLRIGCVC